MKTINIMIVLLLTMSIGTASAIPVTDWSKTYGGTGYDVVHSFEKTSDGGYILVGTANANAWLVKTDSYGNKQWSKTFGSNLPEGAYAVKQTSDGGYILSGYARNTLGNDDGWLIKTDSYGNVQWNKKYGGSGFEGLGPMLQTSDGGYIVVGGTNSYGAGGSDAWLLKVDRYGNKLWSKTFGGSGDERFNHIRRTSDGGYIITGIYGTDASLTKLDSYFNEEWVNTFATGYETLGLYVQQTSDGGYILASEYRWPGETVPIGGLLVKTDYYGYERWRKYYSPLKSAQQTSDGGYILAGCVNCGGTSSNGLVIKTNQYGNQQWSKTFGGTNDDMFSTVRQINNGQYILAGYTMSYGSGGKDGWLMKITDKIASITVTSPNGGENWQRGTVKTVRWRYTGNPGTSVRIELYKGTTLNKVISYGAPIGSGGLGSYNWYISPTQTLGSDYKVRVTSLSNSAYKDISNNNFRIY